MLTDKELAEALFDYCNADDWDTVGTDTQYRCKETFNEYIIFFCPSNSKKDWKINLDFPVEPYEQMGTSFTVHKGFANEWKKIHKTFLSLVKDVTKPITIVGWSYGGAMATLCLEDFWFNYPEKRATTKMVTFGAPRIIGFKNFFKIRERWKNSTMYRNNNDIVTHVPPVIFGYRHVHRLTHIGKHFPIRLPYDDHYLKFYIKNMK